MATIGIGNRVMFVSSEGRRFLAEMAEGSMRVPGLGVVAGADVVAAGLGGTLQIGSRSLRVLKPRLRDVLAALDRKAQIILPKDAAQILMECSIGPGSLVGEAGVGSAGLSVVLAHAVGQQGRVYGFDLRSDHLAVARRNLERAGLAGRVELVESDVADADLPSGLDAFVLDVPDPERIIPGVSRSVDPGGTIACYTPTVGQMEAARSALADVGCDDVRSSEHLERRWQTRERATRPSTKMLGHTGFLTFGTRV